MAKIYRTSDRIKINVEGLVVHISPLTYQKKAEMQALILQGKPMDAAVLALKSSIKDVEGLEDMSGSDYELDFVENELSDHCIDDLLNIAQGTTLNLVAIELLNGVPDEFTDPNTGQKLAGVEFVKEEKSAGKKSRRKAGA